MCKFSVGASTLLGIFEPDTWHIRTFIISLVLVNFPNRFSHLMNLSCILHLLYLTEDLQSGPSSFMWMFFHSFKHPYPALTQRQNLEIDYFIVWLAFFIIRKYSVLMDSANAKASWIKLTFHILVIVARDLRLRSGSRLRVGASGQRWVFVYEGTAWQLSLGYNVNGNIRKGKKLTCIWHWFSGWSLEQDRKSRQALNTHNTLLK